MDIKHVISVPTLAMLKTIAGSSDAAALLQGKNAKNDGNGGLYTWSETYPDEELTRMEIIRVTGVTSGVWMRLSVTTQVLTHGILVRNGIFKAFFSTKAYATNAQGKATINLTLEDTATGTPIFERILWNGSQPVPSSTPAAGANTIIRGDCDAITTDRRQMTHIFTRGNDQSFGIGIAINVLGNRLAPTGTSVQFKVEGM